MMVRAISASVSSVSLIGNPSGVGALVMVKRVTSPVDSPSPTGLISEM